MEIKNIQPVKKAKKGILNVIFSRLFILVALVLIQLFVFAATITFLQEYATYIYAFFLIMGIIIVIYIINNKSNTDFKLTWILLIMATPILGSAFYAYVKIQPGTAVLEKRLSDLSKEIKPYMLQDKQVLEDVRLSKPANANLVSYLTNKIAYPIHRNTSVKYFASGRKICRIKRAASQGRRIYLYGIFHCGKRYHVGRSAGNFEGKGMARRGCPFYV